MIRADELRELTNRSFRQQVNKAIVWLRGMLESRLVQEANCGEYSLTIKLSDSIERAAAAELTVELRSLGYDIVRDPDSFTVSWKL